MDLEKLLKGPTLQILQAEVSLINRHVEKTCKHSSTIRSQLLPLTLENGKTHHSLIGKRATREWSDYHRGMEGRTEDRDCWVAARKFRGSNASCGFASKTWSCERERLECSTAARVLR